MKTVAEILRCKSCRPVEWLKYILLSLQSLSWLLRGNLEADDLKVLAVVLTQVKLFMKPLVKPLVYVMMLFVLTLFAYNGFLSASLYPFQVGNPHTEHVQNICNLTYLP